tara:strand:- start:162 stop:1040 length:879 start_codon:yes stop_codon:yes gene_type:complete
MGTAITGDENTDRVQIASQAYWPLYLRRANDMNEDHEVMNNAYTYIKNGSSGHKNYGYVVSNDDPIELENGLSHKLGSVEELKWVVFNNVNYELAFMTDAGADYEELVRTSNTGRFSKGGLLMRYDTNDEKAIMCNSELLNYDITTDCFNVQGNIDFSNLTSGNSYITCAANNHIDVMGSLFKSNGRIETTDILANTVSCESDRSLKKNIEPIENALEIVGKLNGVTYNWNTDETNSSLEYGFIAQEVETVIPSLVKTNVDSGIKSVDYQKMVSFLTTAIQELRAEIKSLKA